MKKANIYYKSTAADNVVSVLIPCFNHDRYIVDALQSVFNSSYQMIELILIDDASTDNSFNLASKWIADKKSRFVRVLFSRHEVNKGICITLNELVSNASGQFITFLASDDLLIEDGISKQVACALHNNAGFIFSDSRLIDEFGDNIADSAIEYFGRSPRYLVRKNCLIFDVILNWELPFNRIFISSDMLKSVGTFNDKLCYEDRDFIVRVLIHGEFILLSEPVYCYRLRINNRLTPGLDADTMRLDILRADDLTFRQASGIIWLLLGLCRFAGRVRFDKNGNGRRSLVWPFFRIIKILLRRLHLTVMRLSNNLRSIIDG